MVFAHDPKAVAAVFYDMTHVVHRAQGLNGPGYVAVEPEYAVTRRGKEHRSVVGFEQIRDICAHGFIVVGQQSDVGEPPVLHALHGEIGADVERSLAVLADTVDIIARKSVGLVFLFQRLELITVVAVESVSRGNPHETVLVLIDIRDETARKLVVAVIQSARSGVGM